MQKKIDLKPLAELGRGYAVIDENSIEIRVSGVMGALKVWLIGSHNVPLGNVTGGKLIRKLNTSEYHALLITQSGRQMFYGEWAKPEKKEPETVPETNISEESPAPAKENPYAPLPDFGWEEITGRDFPTGDERVRFTLSNNAFFAAFKKHGSYLFGRDGDHYALAIRHIQGDPAPFPSMESTKQAGDYIYVVL